MHLLLFRDLGQAEINESNFILVIDHNVLRLNVTMDDSLGVTMVDR